MRMGKAKINWENLWVALIWPMMTGGESIKVQISRAAPLAIKMLARMMSLWRWREMTRVLRKSDLCIKLTEMIRRWNPWRSRQLSIKIWRRKRWVTKILLRAWEKSINFQDAVEMETPLLRARINRLTRIRLSTVTVLVKSKMFDLIHQCPDSSLKIIWMTRKNQIRPSQMQTSKILKRIDHRKCH